MKKALGTIFQYLIFLGLGIWIIYHMLHQLKPNEKDELINAIESVNLWFILPIFIIGFLSHFFRALRWRLLLETVNVRPTLMNTLFSVFIGYLANLALPRAGEVAKCTVLARYEKAPPHKMVGTIVAERAFDILCLFIVAAISFALQSDIISSYVADMGSEFGDKLRRNQVLLFGILAGIVIAIIILVLLYRRHKETKLGHLMREMSHGIMSIIHMKKRWEFIGYTFLIWLMYTGQIYLGFKALEATGHLSILAALVVLVYGAVGMIVTPGGIGAYTLLVAQILTVYGIDNVPAQAFGWIAWAAQTGILIILGFASLLLIQLYNKKQNGKTAVDTK